MSAWKDTRTWYRKQHTKFFWGTQIMIVALGNLVAIRWLVIPWLASAVVLAVLIAKNRECHEDDRWQDFVDVNDWHDVSSCFAFFGTIIMPWVISLFGTVAVALAGFVFTGDGGPWLRATLDHVGAINR